MAYTLHYNPEANAYVEYLQKGLRRPEGQAKIYPSETEHALCGQRPRQYVLTETSVVAEVTCKKCLAQAIWKEQVA